MNTRTLLRGMLIPALGLLLLAGCDSSDGMKADERPAPGAWTAVADFGSFDFTVNAASTHINYLKCTFTAWTCGSVTRSGSVSVEWTQANSGWSITGNRITIEDDFGSDLEMTFMGTFNANGRQATGTWQAVSFGSTTCSGTWNASAQN